MNPLQPVTDWLNKQSWFRPVAFYIALAAYGVTQTTPAGSKWSVWADQVLKLAAVLGVGSLGMSNSGLVPNKMPVLSSPPVLKSFVLALALGAVLGGTAARAQGFDWSAGPSVPFLEYDFGNPHPVSVAPGAGVQLSVTHDSLKKAFLGKSWDLFSLDLMAFGSVVSAGGSEFGALSAAGAVCTMSSLLCLGGGKHIVSSDQAFTHGGYFMVLALSFNFALAPTAPPTGIESGPRGLVRGNTLYFGR